MKGDCRGNCLMPQSSDGGALEHLVVTVPSAKNKLCSLT